MFAFGKSTFKRSPYVPLFFDHSSFQFKVIYVITTCAFMPMKIYILYMSCNLWISYVQCEAICAGYVDRFVFCSTCEACIHSFSTAHSMWTYNYQTIKSSFIHLNMHMGKWNYLIDMNWCWRCKCEHILIRIKTQNYNMEGGKSL